MLVVDGFDVGMLAFLAAPGVIFLVVELLLVVRTDAVGGRVLPIGLAAFLLLLMWIGYAAASGWDSIGWAFLMMLAGSALVGSLLGCGIGLMFRKLRGRKER